MDKNRILKGQRTKNWLLMKFRLPKDTSRCFSDTTNGWRKQKTDLDNNMDVANSYHDKATLLVQNPKEQDTPDYFLTLGEHSNCSSDNLMIMSNKCYNIFI
jgi:hypothetical protein